MVGNPNGPPVTAADLHSSLEEAAHSVSNSLALFEGLNPKKVIMGMAKRPEPIPDPPRFGPGCMSPLWDRDMQIQVGDLRKALVEIEAWVSSLAEAAGSLDPGTVL